MKNLICISFLFFSLLSKSQTTFENLYYGFSGDWPAVFNTQNGFAVMGRKFFKCDALGDTILTHAYDYGFWNNTGAEKTYDNGFVLEGNWSNSAGVLIEGYFLTQVDSNGMFKWTIRNNDSLVQIALAVCQSADSGFILTGYCKSSPSNNDLLIVKIGKNGNLIWSKVVDFMSTHDYGRSVIEHDGFIYVTGNISLSSDACFLMKIDQSGQIIWTKLYQTVDGNIPYCIKHTKDGGFIISGSAVIFPSFVFPSFVLKLDSAGDYQWEKYFENNQTNFYHIENTDDEGYLITGSVNYPDSMAENVLIVKLNNVGDTIWSRIYGGRDSDAAYSSANTSDGGYLISASSNSFTNGYYIIKTDSLGLGGCNMFMGSLNTTIPAMNQSFLTASSFDYGTASFYQAAYYGFRDLHPICSSVGIHLAEQKINSLVIYPNPSDGYTKIKLPEIVDGILRVFDIRGKKVFESKIINQDFLEFSTKEFEIGFYTVLIESNHGKFVGRLIAN